MKYDLAIVGAGPAGLSAAAAAAQRGVSVVVLDENFVPGGRLLGQLHEEPDKVGPDRWWKGPEIAHRVLGEAQKAGAEVLCGVEVWGIFPGEQGGGWQVCLGGKRSGVVDAQRVLIASGAAEQALPVPGWQTPGVMTIGAAQVMANVHRVKPGHRVVVVGIDVLSLTIARELSLAGVEVVGLVLPAPSPLVGAVGSSHAVMEDLLSMSHMAPSGWMRWIGGAFRGPAPARLAARFYPRGGFRVWGIPIRVRTACLEVLGSDKVEGVILADLDADGHVIAGSQQRVRVDAVCLAGGLYPLVELAAATGCECVNVPELGGYVPLHGPNFETTSAGIYVAGNAAGIEGAPIAMAQGRAAGLAIAADMGRLGSDEAARVLAEAQAAVRAAREAAAIQFFPDIERGRADLQRRWEEFHA